MFTRNELQHCITKICEMNCSVPLYVTMFGSRLYGTSIDTSDQDIKVIFLPFIGRPTEDMQFTGAYTETFKFGIYRDEKTQEICWKRDIEGMECEIEFWSLQVWLNKFLKNGDTGAVDVLFSWSNKSECIFDSALLQSIFENPFMCFCPKNSRAFLGYAIGQATKYGIRGVRFSIIDNILKIIEPIMTKLQCEGASDSEVELCYLSGQDVHSVKLEDYIDAIIQKTYHASYCYVMEKKHCDTWRVLRINGKEHQGCIELIEFYQRMCVEADRYGARAKAAAVSEGRDWKALSHAYRVILEFKELLTTGTIVFPLTYADVIYQIKYGQMTFEQVSQMITEELERVDQLRDVSNVNGAYDHEFIRRSILHVYSTIFSHSNT